MKRKNTPPPFFAREQHQIGPGRKTLYTLWRPVIKGSKSDSFIYRKPNIHKSKRIKT